MPECQRIPTPTCADKHRGADAEVAGERFKLIAMAHGILSDEEKRYVTYCYPQSRDTHTSA